MANSSLTQRVLSAKDRGLTEQEISSYENIPLEDVADIVRYWESDYRSGSTPRLHAAREFIRSRGTETIREFVRKATDDARRRNCDVRRHVVTQLAVRYLLDVDLAGDVLDEVYLAVNVAYSESRVRTRDIEEMVNRMW